MAADPVRARGKKGKVSKNNKNNSNNGNNNVNIDNINVTSVTLGAGNICEVVKKPDGEDLNEWLAMHVVDFFNELTLLYSIISEYSSDEICPIMSAGPKYQYLWTPPEQKNNSNNNKKVKPIKLSAPKYVNRLFTWIDNQINNPQVFPIHKNDSFPDNFQKDIVEPIFKYLFRVYAHLYHHWIQKFVQLDAEAHLNTCFKHFLYFIKEFELVNQREFAPLKNTIDGMLLMDDQRKYKPKYAKAGSGAATATVGTVASGGVGVGGGVATGPSSGTSAAAPAQ